MSPRKISTRQPSATSNRATLAPTKPVAPVTSTSMVRPRAPAYSSSRRKGAATHPLAAVAMMRVVTIDALRGEHGGEADRHPDGRRRRAGLELRHQVGGVPERGARLHCGGAPARLGSPDARRDRKSVV